MLSFLKVFLRGLVITILLPFILAAWILYGIYCLLVFLYMIMKSIILFFKGDSLKKELKEDVEARKIIEERQKAAANANAMLNSMYQATMNQMQAQNAMYGSQPMQQPQYNQPMYQQVPPQQPMFQEQIEQQIQQPVEESKTEEGNFNDGQSY